MNFLASCAGLNPLKSFLFSNVKTQRKGQVFLNKLSGICSDGEEIGWEYKPQDPRFHQGYKGTIEPHNQGWQVPLGLQAARYSHVWRGSTLTADQITITNQIPVWAPSWVDIKKRKCISLLNLEINPILGKMEESLLEMHQNLLWQVS